ncbi:hypothetical protein [Nonomuraea rhizosphaerae]|uniref:hypothetical protein n=1 Tax=Nonomuraea rhizosphaerae TaxID=2665663 RepID=UPI001C5F83D3|nr:hypothetical protein [Nonomuraea rhizosphaerae]
MVTRHWWAKPLYSFPAEVRGSQIMRDLGIGHAFPDVSVRVLERTGSGSDHGGKNGRVLLALHGEIRIRAGALDDVVKAGELVHLGPGETIEWTCTSETWLVIDISRAEGAE